MEIFSLLLAICSGKFTGDRWIPRIKASDAELCLFYMRPNKRFRKQSWGWWFETPSRSFWRHILRFLVIFRNPLLGELWSKLSGQIWKVPILIGFLFCTLIIRFSSSIEVCVLRNCIVPIPCCNDTVCCYCPTTFTQSGQIQVAPNSHMTFSIFFFKKCLDPDIHGRLLLRIFKWTRRGHWFS